MFGSCFDQISDLQLPNCVNTADFPPGRSKCQIYFSLSPKHRLGLQVFEALPRVGEVRKQSGVSPGRAWRTCRPSLYFSPPWDGFPNPSCHDGLGNPSHNTAQLCIIGRGEKGTFYFSKTKQDVPLSSL